MDQEKAREVLGLGPNPSDREIKKRFRELVKKVHPDQGGSVGLLKEIKTAKQTLLESDSNQGIKNSRPRSGQQQDREDWHTQSSRSSNDQNESHSGSQRSSHRSSDPSERSGGDSNEQETTSSTSNGKQSTSTPSDSRGNSPNDTSINTGYVITLFAVYWIILPITIFLVILSVTSFLSSIPSTPDYLPGLLIIFAFNFSIFYYAYLFARGVPASFFS